MKDIIFEIIGSILIIREQKDEVILEKFSREMLQKYPSIKTVVVQTSKIKGIERVREFKHIMGIKTFETIHKEYGNIYELDISTTFFSPRLSYERQRISKTVNKGEVILNFFSGVGPFSIAIAKKCENCLIHSIEMNKNAYHYLTRNIERNKCKDKIKAYCGDAFNIVPQIFYGTSDRVLLPLPLEAEKSLPVAFNALKEGKGTVHWQITEKIIDKEKIKRALDEKIRTVLKTNHIRASFTIINSRLIRWLAPRVAHIAVDLVFS